MSDKTKVKGGARRAKLVRRRRWWEAGLVGSILAAILAVPWERIGITMDISR